MAKEIAVMRADDLKDGEMRQVEVQGIKILLTRLDGVFYAMGGECSHYGGPLVEGHLSGEVVTCPWHQARFDVTTGVPEDPPALEAMCHFRLTVEGAHVMLRLPDKVSGTCRPDMVRFDPEADSRTFVILGAGAAGNAAAEKLRQEGYRGRILVISRETRLPYDRPNLSKGYLAGLASPGDLPLRTGSFYKDGDIEFLLGMEIAQVDPAAREVSSAEGFSLKYDALLVATGGEAVKLEVPGGNLPGVFTLRSADDADLIVEAADKAQSAVVVGASFIGMEAAASLKKRGLDVTVIAPGAVPMERALGREVGGMLQEVHEEQGVAFRLGRKVQRLEGANRVEAVVLDDGTRLGADLVVVGIGVKPATGILKGVSLNPDGSVSVNEFLQVREGLYAAGDIVSFPDWRTGEPTRIEHWRLAEQQGQVAALNMAGKKTAFDRVPFFWTEQFDLFLQYVGHASSWDEVIVHGSLETRKFVAFYVEKGRILAAAGLEHDYGMAYLADLMRTGQMPAPEAVRRGDPEILKNLRK